MSTETKTQAATCNACERRCAIHPDGMGFCGVRRNVNGRLELLTYGRLTACNMSPIEVKPFYHFWPGSRHLSLGSAGCNFRCVGCQNWQIACADNPGEAATIQLPPERAVKLALETGADGISFTYNEPTIWIDYVRDCAALARKSGLLTDLVTNGYMTGETLDSLRDCMDAIRIDVKGTQESYDAITSGIRADVVRRNAQRVRQMGFHLEIVTNLIPGISDSGKVVRDIAEWIAGSLGPETPWHITRFHPARQLDDLPQTRLTSLERALEIGRAAGLRFVYLGNVAGHQAESTWCPDCGTLLLRRTGWGIEDVRLSDHRCPSCSCPIPIVGRPQVTKGGSLGPLPIL